MRKSLAGAAAVALLAASCASLPAQGKAPAWTLTTPKPDARDSYFVGWSSGPDQARATEDAAANLIANIMQYIGVKVTVDSTATARATLESYAADIRQTVTTRSDNRLSGFQVKDTFVARDKKTGTYTVYVLAAYATADLEKEKRRIEAVFQEKIDAVAKPEAEGKALAEQGRLYEATRRFIDAALAASGADIDNADLKLDRNLANARNALSRLRLVPAGGPVTASLGQPFAEPLRVRLVAGEGSAAPGVPGAALFVSYQRKQGSRTVSKTEPAVSGPDGLLAFSPPPPDFVGKAKLVVAVDFQSAIDSLDALPRKWEAQRDSLQAELRGKFVELEYQVVSAARTVPIAVALVDLDEKGAAAGALAQAGLVDALSRERFQVLPLLLDPGLLATGTDQAIADAAKVALGGKADRLAFGRAAFVSARKDGATWLAQVDATLSVLELSTGRLLYSTRKSATGIGSDEAAARKAAYRELGLNQLGKDLLASLP